MHDIPAVGVDTAHTDREVRDRRLMARMRAGDDAALDALLGLYWPKLVEYGARVLWSWDAAEDAAQETFVRIWKLRGEWGDAGSVRALLFRIMRNLALDEKKRRDRRARWGMRRRDDEHRVATPAELLDRSELEKELDLAVAKLPARRREIFVHARMNGLSNREIGDVMGIAPQTVANQLSAALATLRTALGADPPASATPAERAGARIART